MFLYDRERLEAVLQEIYDRVGVTAITAKGNEK